MKQRYASLLQSIRAVFIDAASVSQTPIAVTFENPQPRDALFVFVFFVSFRLTALGSVCARRSKRAVGHVMDEAEDEDSLTARPLFRSRSLPQLHRLGGFGAPPAKPAPRLVAADVRQLLTLKQHYYPEGGWGWVVVVVGVLVQLLSHGLHVAYGVLLVETVRRFGGVDGVVTPAGE